MKTKTIFQTRAIVGNSPEETASLFNDAMVELSELNPKFERDGNMFWIYYTVTQYEPETLADKHELEGEDAHCIDCPYLLRDLNRYGNIDARKKWGTCGKTGDRTHVDSKACEIYHSLAERRRF